LKKKRCQLKTTVGFTTVFELKIEERRKFRKILKIYWHDLWRHWVLSNLTAVKNNSSYKNWI